MEYPGAKLALTRSLKKYCPSCLLLVVLLFSSQAFSIVWATNDGNVVFSEDFNDSALDTSKWAAQENTNLSRYPAWGGAIAVNDSCVWLSSDGSVFPWINTVANPFPSAGDFAVTWKLTYTTIADWGDGFVIYCPPHDDPSNPYANRVMTLWAGDHGPDATSIYIELFGQSVWSLEVPGFRPTSEAHLYRLEYSQGIYTVYVDGKAVTSQASRVRPDGIGIGHPPVYTLPNSPESTQRWAYWGWTASKTDYVKVEALEENTVEPRNAELSMSTSTQVLQIGYRIDLMGRFTCEGSPVPNAQILLSYSSPSFPSDWTPITVAVTDPEGNYVYSWLPTKTGLLTVRASYVGEEYKAAEITRNVTVLQAGGSSLFFVESNSTVTALAFNSTSQEIYFTVSGPSGTSGYVKLFIAIELMPDASTVQVFLDGKQVEHTIHLEGDNWLLAFNYSHSEHHVLVNISQSSSRNLTSPIVASAIIGLVLAAPVGFVLLLRNRKKQIA